MNNNNYESELNQQILQSIDNIDSVVQESEFSVIASLTNCYAKSIAMIQEGCDIELYKSDMMIMEGVIFRGIVIMGCILRLINLMIRLIKHIIAKYEWHKAVRISKKYEKYNSEETVKVVPKDVHVVEYVNDLGNKIQSISTTFDKHSLKVSTGINLSSMTKIMTDMQKQLDALRDPSLDTLDRLYTKAKDVAKQYTNNEVYELISQPKQITISIYDMAEEGIEFEKILNKTLDVLSDIKSQYNRIAEQMKRRDSNDRSMVQLNNISGIFDNMSKTLDIVQHTYSTAMSSIQKTVKEMENEMQTTSSFVNV